MNDRKRIELVEFKKADLSPSFARLLAKLKAASAILFEKACVYRHFRFPCTQNVCIYQSRVSNLCQSTSSTLVHSSDHHNVAEYSDGEARRRETVN